MPVPSAQPALSRRRLLSLAGAGAVSGLLSGCSSDLSGRSPVDNARCVARTTLDSHRSLSGQPFFYEVSRARASFSFEPKFFTGLGDWFDDYARLSGQARPDQVWTYGAWRGSDGSCSSWHQAGRAFDLARLRLDGGDFVSCRYDRWRSDPEPARERALRRYWALAASLHLHFAYVLTYHYDSRHFNHIHVDNSRSGNERSTFSTRSRVQVQAVQAICGALWGAPVEVTGRWDSDTRRASRRALDELEVAGDLDDGVEAWRAFLTASAARGGD
jgi:hypothetical protein